MDEDANPRATKDAAELLKAEDLSPYSQDELEERIALLKAEISRVVTHRNAADKHRAQADALFGKRSN